MGVGRELVNRHHIPDPPASIHSEFDCCSAKFTAKVNFKPKPLSPARASLFGAPVILDISLDARLNLLRLPRPELPFVPSRYRIPRINAMQSDRMQSVQKRFVKLRGKTSTADNATVSATVKDYEDIERAITKIIEDAQHLQQSWSDISVFQLNIAKGFQDIYEPILGTTEGEGRPSGVNTPRHIASRTNNLHEAYAGLQEEMAVEITSIETQLLRPATDARDMILPIRGTIKKREAKRVDYENAHEKVTKLQRKTGRSVKEESALAKAQETLAHVAEEFEAADSHLRDALPPLVRATFSILPPLLAINVTIQNRLLGLLYTVLHEYCLENGFPSPPPHMDEVVAEWNAAFQPVVKEVDGFAVVRKHPGLHMRPAGTRVPTFGKSPAQTPVTAPVSRIPSNSSSLNLASPSTNAYDHPSPSESPQPRGRRPSGLSVPTDFTTATVLRGGRSPSASGRSQQGDYFAQVASKKKPPPPPPGPKPKPVRQAEYVVALYDFAGDGAGDLSFRAGDEIKIIHKTDTDQDWWEGQLGNTRGSFPANYCRPIA
ncbi:hypothetical protein G7046_g7681 [Stylonectria norvegica]|nr:hypothetical protein G7046_g7681 [Stylonectria norvegica]